VENGVGYDSWAAKALAASPDPRRAVINVGELVGVPKGGNPHRWYDPADVHAVASAVTADLIKLDPADADYFTARHTQFAHALAPYDQLIAQLRTAYAGVPIGASESVFAPMADSLGLTLLTPPTFLRAISEGTEPSAADKATIDDQIAKRAIKVYVYNSQNATPDVALQVAAARAAGIPVVPVTETLTPASATFQDWQVAQLRALQAALATVSLPAS
jgi:zinc/manganese transport system substrate-binding protein